jgi:hypothetical protein
MIEEIPLSAAFAFGLLVWNQIRGLYLAEEVTKKIGKAMHDVGLMRYMGSMEAIRLMNLPDDKRKEEERRVLEAILKEITGH